MLTVSHRHVLPYVCAACGYPMRATDVCNGLITHCTSCDARLFVPDDDPSPRETVRLSAADLAALRAQID